MPLPRIVWFVILLALPAVAQREQFRNVDVMYDWVVNHSGQKLRTFITRPKTVAGKVPAIFFVGWLSCDTMEYPDANTHDGFGIFMRRLIDESGYSTVRMDKPGVGESQGDCSKADFNSEMEGWRAAFESLGKYDFLDRERVFVVGSVTAVVLRRWRRSSIRCGDSSLRVHGGVPGTSTCWNSNGVD